MKCNFCGAEIPDNSKFCEECGKKQPEIPIEKQTATLDNFNPIDSFDKIMEKSNNTDEVKNSNISDNIPEFDKQAINNQSQIPDNQPQPMEYQPQNVNYQQQNSPVQYQASANQNFFDQQYNQPQYNSNDVPPVPKFKFSAGVITAIVITLVLCIISVLSVWGLTVVFKSEVQSNNFHLDSFSQYKYDDDDFWYSQSTESDPEYDFLAGKIDDNIYTNEYFNVKINLSEDFIYEEDDDIANYGNGFDLYSNNNDYSKSVSVYIESINYYNSDTAKGVAEEYFSGLMNNDSYTDLKKLGDSETKKINGAEFYTIYYEKGNNDNKTVTGTYYLIKDEYVYSIDITCNTLDEVKDLEKTIEKN